MGNLTFVKFKYIVLFPICASKDNVVKQEITHRISPRSYLLFTFAFCHNTDSL